MCRWGLVASCDLDRHRARNVHARVGLKERNAALGVQDTASRACLQERPAQWRINSVSIQANIGLGQMHKLVNCNFRFLDRLFGSKSCRGGSVIYAALAAEGCIRAAVTGFMKHAVVRPR